MKARIGDRIEVASRRIGEPPRRGEITDIGMNPTVPRFRVRWDSGAETIYFPDASCSVLPRAATRATEPEPETIDLRTTLTPNRLGRVAKAIVSLDEGELHTEARVTLHLRDYELTGFGAAHRNPHDPNLPAVGEELATARALSDLAHQLLDLASYQIEKHEGRPVHVEL